ncbi:unnamed protein product [Urochloa humidicola]
MVGPLISPLGAEEEEGVAAAAAAAAMAPIGESRKRKLSHAAGRSTHPAQIWRWGPDGDAGRSGPELDPAATAATRSAPTDRRCPRRRFRPRHWICIGKVDATPPGTVHIEAAAPAPGRPPFPQFHEPARPCVVREGGCRGCGVNEESRRRKAASGKSSRAGERPRAILRGGRFHGACSSHPLPQLLPQHATPPRASVLESMDGSSTTAAESTRARARRRGRWPGTRRLRGRRGPGLAVPGAGLRICEMDGGTEAGR